MIINPTEEQRAAYSERRAIIEREIQNDGDTYGYEVVAIDYYCSEELMRYFDNLKSPGKYHLGYCDKNDGRIMAYKTIK